MANAAERVLDAETAANALVAELGRLKSAAESIETAHSDTERAARAAHDVVTTLNDVMPAVARVLEQLQALDLPELTQRLTGEIRAVTEPVNQAAAILETLPAEVAAIREAQTRTEKTLAANSQATLKAIESLEQQISKRDEAQAEDRRRLIASLEDMKEPLDKAAAKKGLVF